VFSCGANTRSFDAVRGLDDEEALTNDEKDAYTKIFREFDTDKSGDISTSELDEVLKAAKFTFNQIPGSSAWLVSMIDCDGSKTLSEGEAHVCVRAVTAFVDRRIHTLHRNVAQESQDLRGI
jgi:hypothetical protein